MFRLIRLTIKLVIALAIVGAALWLGVRLMDAWNESAGAAALSPSATIEAYPGR